MSSTTSAGSPALVAPVAPVTPPANAESSLIDRAKNAKTPAELKALREEYMKPAPTPPPAKAPDPAPTEPAAEEQPPEEPAAEAAPTSEEDPAPTGEPTATEEGGSEDPPADEADGGSDEADGEESGDGPVTPHGGKRAHLRFADNDEVGRLAASYKQRNRDWTLEQALQAAKKQLGVKDEQADGGKGDQAPKPKSDMPSTIEDVDSALEQLINQKNAKMVSLEFEEVTKIDAAIRKLDRHRVVLEKDAERQQSQQVTEYNRKYDGSQSRAAELYPFSVDPNSPGGKRMIEIERQLRENDDPLDRSPDKPMKIAQMVAAELNIAPRKKGAPAPAKAAAPATPPAPKKGVLPTGGSRTTVAPSTQPAINDEIGKIRTVADMRAFRQKHGLPI